MKIPFVPKYAVLFALIACMPLLAHAATRTLSFGISGSDVRAMQNTFITKGYLSAGKATGTFGPATLAAVKKFQCANKIVCSGSSYGVVGPKTMAALGSKTGGTVGSANVPPSTPVSSLEVGGWV